MTFHPVRTLPHRCLKSCNSLGLVRPEESSWIGGETSPADHDTELRRFQTLSLVVFQFMVRTCCGAAEGADWFTGNIQADMMNWFKMIRGNKWLPDHRTASPQHRGVVEAVWD